MSDERFDQDLRSVLLEDAPRDVPDDLRRRVAAIPAMHPVAARASRSTWRGPALFGAGVLAAAAVVVLALGVIRLGPPNEPEVGSQPTPSAPVATPSAPLATPSVAPSPSPSTVAEVTACRAADLEGRILSWQGAAGNRIAEVEITNRGTVACIIQGTPGLQLVDANDRVLIDSATAGPSGKPHAAPTDPSFELASDDKVSTEVQASNYCGATPTPPIDIVFDLPSSGGQLVATPAEGVSSGEAVPPCNGPVPGAIAMNGWRQ
jgi:hypothetical protein